jgi:dihydrofolate reductase
MNKVFIATSLDGYIADHNGNIDWLHAIPNPEGIDMGYGDFMSSVDALVMGRTTYETVLGFDIPWPYDKPVFVLSSTLKEVPEDLSEKVFLVNGALKDVLSKIHAQGYQNLYIDGGQTIQSFLRDGLISEMIITRIPILLGGGSSLFGILDVPQHFKCVDTKIFLGQIVQNHFIKTE